MNTPSSFSQYLSLSKPRICLMVGLTTLAGYFLAEGSLSDYSLLGATLFGVLCSGAGACALNNYFDRDVDALMNRTSGRALPMGHLKPLHAVIYGLFLILLGAVVLYWKVNALTCLLSVSSAFLYVLVYTPLKRVTWLNTYVGAVPGALPAAGGWTAATGALDAGAIILFFLLFFWQLPHFYSIAWLYRDDYRRGHLKMLPGEDVTGTQTFIQVMICSALLAWVSILPTFFGITGQLYLGGALVLGYLLMAASFFFVEFKTTVTARQLLRGSLLYLPAIFILMVCDRMML